MWRSLLAGILLLLPIGVVAIVLAKVFQFSRDIATPVLTRLSLENPNAWLIVDGTAAVLLLSFCFLLGKLSRNKSLSERFEAIDSLLVDYFPRYIILKSFLRRDASGEGRIELPSAVAIVSDGGVHLGLEIERDETSAVVYFPEAPSVWNGSYVIVPVSQVRPLDIPAQQIAKLSRNLGRGSLKALPPDIFSGDLL